MLFPGRLKITSDFPAAIFLPEADAHAATARPELAILGNNVLIERPYAQSSGLLLKNAHVARNDSGPMTNRRVLLRTGTWWKRAKP